MDYMIHHVEREAYSSVLRAFKYQSNDLTWDKVSLITDIRKELGISEDEHRELLDALHIDETLNHIWKRRNRPVHEVSHCPTVSTSRKKQKTSQSHPSAGPTRGTNVTNLSFHRDRTSKSPCQEVVLDPMIGKKVLIRRNKDQQFYEVVVTDYDPDKGQHAVVYNADTPNAATEWIDLVELLPENIRWEGEDAGRTYKNEHSGQGHDGNTIGARRRNRKVHFKA